MSTPVERSVYLPWNEPKLPEGNCGICQYEFNRSGKKIVFHAKAGGKDHPIHYECIRGYFQSLNDEGKDLQCPYCKITIDSKSMLKRSFTDVIKDIATSSHDFMTLIFSKDFVKQALQTWLVTQALRGIFSYPADLYLEYFKKESPSYFDWPTIIQCLSVLDDSIVDRLHSNAIVLPTMLAEGRLIDFVQNIIISQYMTRGFPMEDPIFLLRLAANWSLTCMTMGWNNLIIDSSRIIWAIPFLSFVQGDILSRFRFCQITPDQMPTVKKIVGIGLVSTLIIFNSIFAVLTITGMKPQDFFSSNYQSKFSPEINLAIFAAFGLIFSQLMAARRL